MVKASFLKQARLISPAFVIALMAGLEVPASALTPFNLPSHGYLPDSLNTVPNSLGTRFDRNFPLPGSPGSPIFEFSGGKSIAPTMNQANAVGQGCGTVFTPGLASGQICQYSDLDNDPNAPYHFEVEILGPTPQFNLIIITSNGFVGGTLLPIAAGQSVFMEAQFHELPETKAQLYTWFVSTLQTGVALTWSIVENPFDPNSNPPPIFSSSALFGFPVSLGEGIQGGAIGSNPWAATFDETADNLCFGTFESSVLTDSDLRQCANFSPPATPEPASLLGVLALSLLGTGSALLRRKNGRN